MSSSPLSGCSAASLPPLAAISIENPAIREGFEQALPIIMPFLNPATIGTLAKTCRGLSQRLASDIYWQFFTERVIEIMPPSIVAASADAPSTSFQQIAISCLQKFNDLMAKVMTIKPEFQGLTSERVEMLLKARAMCLVAERLAPPPSFLGNNTEEALLQSAQRFKDWLKTPAALALTTLELPRLQLDSLPGEIGQLSNLEDLYLHGNKLTALPPEIGQLSSIKGLYLMDNQLTALPPEIGQLSSLRLLSLTNNQLTKLPPEIGQLLNLVALYLGNNQLTTLPKEIRQLSSLKYLYLNDNQLTALPPEIGKLSSLSGLYLNNNQLTALPPEIGQLLNLEDLDLTSNQLTTLPVEIITLSNLRVLRLEGNKLSMDALPPLVAAWMREKGFTLGEQQPRPVLAATGDRREKGFTLKRQRTLPVLAAAAAGAGREKRVILKRQRTLPVSAAAAAGAGALPPVEQGRHTEQKNDSQNDR